MKTLKMTVLAMVVAVSGMNIYNSQVESKNVDHLTLENVEALAGVIVGENDMVGSYAWSPEIDCPGWFNGDYQVCQVNGPQAACFVPGAVTCDCEKNCD